MGVIGKEIKRYKTNEFDLGFHLFWWFCCLLFMITFAFMTYLCWIEQMVTVGSRYGSNNYTLIDKKAIDFGYIMFTMLMLSLGAGFIESRFKHLIWFILTLVWLAVVIWVYFNIT